MLRHAARATSHHGGGRFARNRSDIEETDGGANGSGATIVPIRRNGDRPCSPATAADGRRARSTHRSLLRAGRSPRRTACRDRRARGFPPCVPRTHRARAKHVGARLLRAFPAKASGSYGNRQLRQLCWSFTGEIFSEFRCLLRFGAVRRGKGEQFAIARSKSLRPSHQACRTLHPRPVLPKGCGSNSSRQLGQFRWICRRPCTPSGPPTASGRAVTPASGRSETSRPSPCVHRRAAPRARAPRQGRSRACNGWRRSW